MLDVLGFALGFPMDPEKSVDASVLMDVLGIEVDLQWAKKLVSTCVSASKASKWTAALQDIIDQGVCSPELASNMAGRLSFAVTATCDRVGRAFVKPLYAQANHPMRGWRCSTLLLNACIWWRQYLQRRLKSSHSVAITRPHWICWSDAAGATRLVAAVIVGPRGLYFTRARVPDWLWNQFLPRRDNQIGVQEALAVWLLVCSFRRVLGSALLTIYVDNDGVSAASLKGSSDSPEVNSMVAVFWLFVARFQMHPIFYRVESKANIADGPTRPDDIGCSLLHQLGAVEFPAYLSGWFANLWHPFANDALACEDIPLGLS